MKKFLYRIFCGFFLGISIFAPGFSGSVVAIAMGIYHEFLQVMSNPLKNIKKNILFCTPLGVGLLVSAVVFVLAFKQLFDSHEKAIYLLFIGLIAGSMPIVFAEVKKVGFKPMYLIGAFIACIIAIALGIFATGEGIVSSDLAAYSNLPGVAIGGFAAGVTALIPGMSLSTVLVLLGVYTPLIYAAEALIYRDLIYILPIVVFVVSLAIGLISTARGIKYVFKKFPGFANTTIIGFLFGSLFSVAYQSHYIDDPNFNWILGGIMLLAGLGISVIFVVMSKYMNKTE
ncbi:MAG: DUF368 domain-containing protein [Oscillospiraceae bacterium]|jgi:putative membrane protein|nr:DUF368 domain-containing protein [Oscillospiraceae bacterium]